jgi:hypothetical protein
MNHPIYHLRDAQLDTRLMYQLAPFIDAYRPHDPIPTKEELGEKVTRTHVTLNDLKSQITL